MDVRCEKCQTEYELDENRLKPGGVTVKCTNCGHMFKIRKRTQTNVGMPVQATPEAGRARTPSSKPPVPAAAAPPQKRPDSIIGDGAPLSLADQGSGPASERQWLIRLENGEQKSCRELASLQQWIVAAVVTRESLISRSGKTWKRLGDIAELGQYFAIADEARSQRSGKPTGKPTAKPGTSTVLGVGPASLAPTGGPVADEEELDLRATGQIRVRGNTAPPHPPPKANPIAQTELASSQQPPPAAKLPVADGNRATAAWANGDIKTSESMAAMPQGPRAGKISANPDEPAFSGRVRMQPGDESAFDTGKVRPVDDDDDLLPARRGSRAGMWIALFALLVIGGAAGVVYMFVFKPNGKHVAGKPPTSDAATVAIVTPDAAAVAPPPAVDAAAAPETSSPLDSARAELIGNVEPRMHGALDALATKDDPASLAMRARLATGLAQAAQDRAGLLDKPAGDKLRKELKQIVVDAAPLAQRAFKAQADDPSANLAMAEVLRLQGKPARDVRRYVETARTNLSNPAHGSADKELVRSVALAEALLSVREGKLDDAQKTLAATDAAADTRVQFQLALVAYAQNRPQDAKPIVDQILAVQSDHDGARALDKKLATVVAKTDPLPPEDGKGSGAAPGAGSAKNPDVGVGGGGGDYDSLLVRANKLAESNCTKAMELFGKALDQKPNGVEALTGMGYCYLDSKQFSSAFSKFRTALMVSAKYEPALGGIAETYQRQGNKEMAIESWRKYLDVYPGSAKAKKQLELLGASPEGGGGSSGGGGGAAPGGGSTGGAEPPAPPPAPAPAPAGSGSG